MGQSLCLEYFATVVWISIVQCKLAFYSLETTKNIIGRDSFHDVGPLALLKFENS